MQETTGSENGQPGKLRLTCDTMLGKLARNLRALGVDVEYRRGIGGMRAHKQARGQERLFLTRANKLRELPGVYFVESNDPAEQLAQVRERFQIVPAPPAAEPPVPAAVPAPPVPEAPGGRCLECNVALEKLSRDQARPSIPFFIYQIHHDFSRCPKCKRVYWPGSHARDMQQRAAASRPRPRRGREQGGRGEPRRSNRSGGKEHGGSSGRQQPKD